MYESKYRQYVTLSTNRFAEEDEILRGLDPAPRGAGVPLYAKDGAVYVDDKDNHSMIIGGTGCGKSRCVSKTTIRAIIEAMENAIVNDPKGELYKATAHFAKQRGYNVQVLNLRNPEKSARWNPLYQIYWYYINGHLSKAYQAIDDLAKTLMSSIESERDRYWEQMAGDYFAAIVGICMMCSEDASHFTFENILPLLRPSGERIIKIMLGKLNDVSESVISSVSGVHDLDASQTKSCVYSVLRAGIGSLVKNDSLLKLFDSNEIDFYKMAEEPTVIYIIYPDEKQAMNNVVSAFLTQAYTSLLDICDSREDNKLPIRVNFVLDEFSNLCPIEAFDNRISEARSKNVRYHLFIQSMNQLGEKYGGSVAETILSNCTSWICFSSKESKFLETLSSLCGTVIDHTGRERLLISPSELQYLEKGEDDVEVLILRQGVRPYISRLPYFDKLYGEQELLPERETRTLTTKVKLSTNDWMELAGKCSGKPKKETTIPVTADKADKETEAFLKLRFDAYFGPIDGEG